MVKKWRYENVQYVVVKNQDLLKNKKKNLKRRVYYSFKDNVQGANLARMELISKFNKATRFLLCVTDIFK